MQLCLWYKLYLMNRLFPFYRGIQTDALETTTMAACHPIYTARYETAEIGKLRQSANQNSFRPTTTPFRNQVEAVE